MGKLIFEQEKIASISFSSEFDDDNELEIDLKVGNQDEISIYLSVRSIEILANHLNTVLKHIL